MADINPFDRVRRLREADRRREHDSGTDRTPPGQVLTSKFPVLTYGRAPSVAPEDWRLRLFGKVEAEIELDWDGLRALESETQTHDIHCVTRWSKLDTAWTGVPFRVVHEMVQPLPAADHVMLHAMGGYTTNMRLDEMLDESVLIAFAYEGEPIPRDHGGPVRLIVPKLYFWKSAKWLSGIEYMVGNKPGFWEENGYHMHGDPWDEERFS